ncbi:hypothetical protein [Pseudothermotoga thermarum]|uniref:hypothetical protein n=1 Tax=Pseudothermotoga thermarum TaxID=119394 RepID=UPI001B7FCAEE|nr:hypothetical protein [Pseudothermotoga thermarum]
MRGNELSQNAAQVLNAHSVVLQLLQSELIRKSQQETKQVNPENKIEDKLVKSSVEEEAKRGSYQMNYSRRQKIIEPLKEESKGCILDVRL